MHIANLAHCLGFRVWVQSLACPVRGSRLRAFDEGVGAKGLRLMVEGERLTP